MSLCRVCGADCLPDEVLAGGNGCHRCNGMPPCGRCGHPHARHHGRCEVRVGAFGGIAIGRCGCPEYSPVPVADELEPTEVHLRRPGQALPAL